LSVLSEKILNLPAAPGVYLFKDARGEVLYIGKALRLSSRVRSYLAGDSSRVQVEGLMAEAADLDVILTDSEVEAVLLESTLVRQHKPRYNIELKDDKSFPYVRISVQEEYPRLSITRQVKADGARYLGPFTDVKLLRRSLREIRQVFPVRTCRDFEDHVRADRPCLYFHIRRCVGPCTTMARVNAEEYRALVDGLILFLTRRDRELLDRLGREMEEAAAARRYEIAARRRDQLRLLERVRSPQNVVSRRGRNTDVLGAARHGARAAVVTLRLRGGRMVGKETRMLERAAGAEAEDLIETFVSQHYLAQLELPRRIVVGEPPSGAAVMAEALERRAGHPVEIVAPRRGRERQLVRTAERNAALAIEDQEARASGRRARFVPEVTDLQRVLGLPRPPHQLVCFDISNLGPEGAVAAVVASRDGRAQKSLYRRMRMRRSGPDDVGMIREAVERYWARVETGELPRPDLVVVDGGVGQVRAARDALDRTSSQPVALVGLAKREETVVRERGAPIRLARRSPGLRTLQRVRDEAHRFGLAYQRKLSRRARIVSELDRVPGIGPGRRAALLRAFGSVAALREAPAEEVARAARIPLALASRVLATLGVVAGETREKA
jgi:excinuclease ABC subunit C